MGEFQELIRNFDKIRDYMRDFYIYGFRSRNDFTQKSARTYDNEKRRIESYMGDYMKWEYTKTGKNAFISMDCSRIPVNPLYAAWKSKTFTNNDIMLHFYILDAFREGGELSINQLTDTICERSGQVFDTQTVRNKCKEYIALGMLKGEKKGKSLYYSLSKDSFERLLSMAPGLLEAISFFQGAGVFGEVGSFLMDHQGIENQLFSFRHYYVAHTLEDGILFEILSAIRNHQELQFENQKETGGWISYLAGVPLKVFISAATGRRYVCVYKTRVKRFFNYRLDHIKLVKIVGNCEKAEDYLESLERNINKVWGVSFEGENRIDLICMKLYINEQTEKYVLERLEREGHGGKVSRLEENIYLYTKEMYDSNDISPWIKTFMGRILALEGTNQTVIGRFYNDIGKMMRLYED